MTPAQELEPKKWDPLLTPIPQKDDFSPVLFISYLEAELRKVRKVFMPETLHMLMMLIS